MKHSSYRDILLEILQIADYQDKENFIVEFERINHLDTIINILPQLSPEVQEYIKENIGDTEKIRPYIPYDLYLKELLSISADALSNFLTYIKPTLNPQQNESMRQLFAA